MAASWSPAGLQHSTTDLCVRSKYTLMQTGRVHGQIKYYISHAPPPLQTLICIHTAPTPTSNQQQPCTLGTFLLSFGRIIVCKLSYESLNFPWEIDTAVNLCACFFPQWVECRMSQWADINRQSCKVRRYIAKTEDESLLTSKMIIALTDSITTFGSQWFPWKMLQNKLKWRDCRHKD